MNNYAHKLSINLMVKEIVMVCSYFMSELFSLPAVRGRSKGGHFVVDG